MITKSLYAVVGIVCLAAVTLNAQEAENGKKATLPVKVYAEGVESSWAPSGWMGDDTKNLTLDMKSAEQPKAGAACIKATYSGAAWVAVAWQDPASDWGDAQGGWDLTGAKKLTFWARGEKGGEKIEVKMGIIKEPKKYFDKSGEISLGEVTLTVEWKQYSIDLTGKDLTRVKTPFVFSVKSAGAPFSLYLDEIQYE